MDRVFISHCRNDSILKRLQDGGACVCVRVRERGACTCTHSHLRARREQGLTWSPGEDAWDSVRIGGVVTARCCFLLFCLAGWPPPWGFQPFRPDTSFITWGWAPEESNILTAFALSSHLAEGLAPRGVSLGAPSRRPLAGCRLAGVLDQGGPVLPLSLSFRHSGPRPCSTLPGFSPPHLLPVWPWRLPDPPTTVVLSPLPGWL